MANTHFRVRSHIRNSEYEASSKSLIPLLRGLFLNIYGSYMISWSSQIWLLSPLKFFFYVVIFVLKPGTSPDCFILSLLFLLFLYVFSFNVFVLCYGDLVEVEPRHLNI